MASKISVTSRIKLDVSKLNIIDAAALDAMAMAADAALTETRTKQVMPFDKGTLQNDSTFVDDKNKTNGKVSIVSSTPYARRLYFHPEYNFRRNNNSSAGGRWFDWLLDANFIKKAFGEIWKRKGGL